MHQVTSDHQQDMPEEDIFDPKIHLAYKPPSTTFTLTDLGLPQPPDSSAPIAGTLPFPFLSPAGVLAYRRSILRPSVLSSCGRPFGPSTLILRNLGSKSKFVSDLWSCAETTRVVSDALGGLPVEVIMPMEMGHTNVQVNGGGGAAGGGDVLAQVKVEPSGVAEELTDEQKTYDPLGANSVIPWHYDSYPFVCIVMLSDTTAMVGGDTYIQTGDGSAKKVEGPSLGSAVVLQGGQVKHLAARAFGTGERITTISSYRVAKIGCWDNSYISNVRPYDSLPELYTQWSLYRLRKMREEIEAMEARIRGAMETAAVGKMNGRVGDGDGDASVFPFPDIEESCQNLADYALRTTRQMTDPRLRDHVMSKFGHAGVGGASETWNRIKTCPDFEMGMAKAMEMTENGLPEWRVYLLDWCETKAKLARGIALPSQNGLFEWKEGVEYLFGDELVRQGLKETLLDWMDKVGLLELA